MIENIYLKALVEFFIIFLLVFIFNYIFVIRKQKKYNKERIPLELIYLVRLYGLNIKKINYRKFVWFYSMINTFIISIVYIIANYLISNFIAKLVVGSILIILLIIICYGLLGRYYMKKEGK